MGYFPRNIRDIKKVVFAIYSNEKHILIITYNGVALCVYALFEKINVFSFKFSLSVFFLMRQSEKEYELHALTLALTLTL